ncbi:MAG: M23 family metallopeptidase [Aquificae bacterium]|nr:M23 family metallopeptidase [Aquificota bacterium]
MVRLLLLLLPTLVFALERCVLRFDGEAGSIGLLECRNLKPQSTYRIEVVEGFRSRSFAASNPRPEDLLPFAVPYYWSGRLKLRLYRDGKLLAEVPLEVKPLQRGVSRIRISEKRTAAGKNNRTGKTAAGKKPLTDRRRAYELVRKTLRRYTPVRYYEERPLFPLRTYKRISSPFGVRRWVNGKPSGFHKGLDLAAPYGTPVLASLSGRVVLARYLPLTGYTVILDHGWGLMTLYAHLSEITVSEGSFVKRGQVIGKVGSTGRSTGPHLHFGVYLNDSAVDPQKFFKLRLRPAGGG